MNVDLALWKQVLVIGLAEAGLFALLPIALVLSYRVSRTIAFVHGGIAASAALLYWWTVFPTGFVPGYRPELSPVLGLLAVVAVGAALGLVYGLAMTKPTIAALPKMTLTVASLGAMMISIGIFSNVLDVVPESIPPSPFGGQALTVFGVVLTPLRWITLLVAVGLCAALAAFLSLSRTGRHLKAVSDDLEAAAWSGVPIARVGAGVHAAAGAVAALAGVLIAAQSGPDPVNLIIFLLRGLTVAIVGGLMSLPLALGAAVVLGVVQSALIVGVVGQPGGAAYSIGKQELILSLVLLAMILAVAKVRPRQFYLLERQSL